MKAMSYNQKKQIANVYIKNLLSTKYPLYVKNGIAEWDDLDDINSLKDADNMQDIIALCNERLNATGFIF